VKRRTRRGRTFYGCSNYPTCGFTIWKEPLSTACPQCGGLLVVDRKGWAKCYHCQEEFEIDSLPVGEAVSE
jgi:DNA topoisomerase-1